MSDTPDAETIKRAAGQAIVFRQHFPPQFDRSARSFFGGAPIAPRGFQWPRSGSGVPFSFLMQVDCAAVPPAARLDLLPDRGVLYFFIDLTWGTTDNFRVVYEEVGATAADLGVAFGEPSAAFVWQWTQSAADCPVLLPKWTFDPIAIEIPPEVYEPGVDEDEREPDAPLLWPGGLKEPLRAAQGADVVSNWFRAEEFFDAQGALLRPFANYPHDWRAVQICSGLLLKKVSRPGRVPGIAALRDVSESDRAALVTRIADEAQRWFTLAASQSPFAAVPQPDADRFWSWLADKGWLVRFVLGDALTLSIEASLCDSSESAARVPADVAARMHYRHVLASRSGDDLFVTTPDRMLAPPRDVQGNQWERAKTHLLLLEVSSNEGLGHHFGEGVYQFWITSDDLRARRFDRVALTSDAY